MGETDEVGVCKEHSGFLARIGSLEHNVSELWAKWNGMQKMVIGTLISAFLSLVGVIILLVRG